VSENSAYHHGEQSLCSTIVGMAQNFVGSNSVNLLLPNGQFGTRSQGGKDAASARYIFTTLSPVTRALFHPDDDALLTYQEDDGQAIEPEFYIPVLPVVLINGSAGIGTGYASNVPNYDPRAIASNLKKMIAIHDQVAAEAEGDVGAMDARFLTELDELHPHYRGFAGEIKQKGAGSYVVKGVIEKLPDGNSLHIKELPVQTWTGDYKLTLEAMLEAGEIKEFTEHHTDTRASFVVRLTDEQMSAYESGGMTLYKKFKLNTSLSTTNMVLFDSTGKLKKYASANHILVEFFHERMRFYVARKAMLLAVAKAEQRILSDKARFVREVNNGTIIVKQGKAKVLDALVRGKYKAQPKKSTLAGAKASQSQSEENGGESADDEEADGVGGGSDPRAKDYDYLLSMPIWSLTKERAALLEKEAAKKGECVDRLRETTPSETWVTDLDSFEEALDLQQRNEAGQEKAATARSIEKRLAQCKSDEARKKLRAQLKNPVPRGERVEDHTDDFDPTAPVKVKKPRAKQGATTPSADAVNTPEEAHVTTGDQDMMDVDGVSTPAPEKKKEKETAKTPNTSKKRQASPPPSDDESERDSADDDDGGNPPPPRVRAVRAAAATKKNYVVPSGEFEEEEEEEREEADDEDDAVESEEDEPVVEVAPKRSSPGKRKKAEEQEEDEEEAPRPKKQQKVGAKSPTASKKSPARSPAKSSSRSSPAKSPAKRAAPSPKASSPQKKRKTEPPVPRENEEEEDEDEIELGEISDENYSD
jgi:DNA topoisomerase-2